MPLRRTIQAAGDAGAAGVQFDCRTQVKPRELGTTARGELRHLLEERNLGIASLTMPLRKPLADEEHLDARLDALREAMDFAAELKCRTLTVAIGPWPVAKSPDAARLLDVLNDLAKYGNHVGVVFTISAPTDSATIAKEWLESVTQGPLQWDFDPASWVFLGQDPVPALKTLHEHIGHVQIREGLASLDRPGTGEETAVGRGEVEWEPLLACIDDIKYRGWLTVRRTNGSNVYEDSKNALAYIRRVAGG